MNDLHQILTIYVYVCVYVRIPLNNICTFLTRSSISGVQLHSNYEILPLTRKWISLSTPNPLCKNERLNITIKVKVSQIN